MDKPKFVQQPPVPGGSKYKPPAVPDTSENGTVELCDECSAKIAAAEKSDEPNRASKKAKAGQVRVGEKPAHLTNGTKHENLVNGLFHLRREQAATQEEFEKALGTFMGVRDWMLGKPAKAGN